jgi:uncharacterized protein (DUF1499 family)
MATNGKASGGWTARLGTFGLAAAIAGPLCAHSDLVTPLTGFLVMAIGLLLALVSIIAGLIALVRGGGAAAARAMIPGLLVIGAIAAVLVTGGGGDHPRINDITTDTERPPELVRAAMLPENLHRDMRYPGEDFARQQREGYPNLAPLKLEMAPDEAYARVVQTARATDGWEITREDPATRTLEGTATSWLFRFRDDFVVEVRPEGQGSMVHMRSKSRDGKGDMGVNAARIRDFLARLGPGGA